GERGGGAVFGGAAWGAQAQGGRVGGGAQRLPARQGDSAGADQRKRQGRHRAGAAQQAERAVAGGASAHDKPWGADGADKAGARGRAAGGGGQRGGAEAQGPPGGAGAGIRGDGAGVQAELPADGGAEGADCGHAGGNRGGRGDGGVERERAVPGGAEGRARAGGGAAPAERVRDGAERRGGALPDSGAGGGDQPRALQLGAQADEGRGGDWGRARLGHLGGGPGGSAWRAVESAADARSAAGAGGGADGRSGAGVGAGAAGQQPQGGGGGRALPWDPEPGGDPGLPWGWERQRVLAAGFGAGAAGGADGRLQPGDRAVVRVVLGGGRGVPDAADGVRAVAGWRSAAHGADHERGEGGRQDHHGGEPGDDAGDDAQEGGAGGRGPAAAALPRPVRAGQLLRADRGADRGAGAARHHPADRDRGAGHPELRGDSAQSERAFGVGADAGGAGGAGGDVRLRDHRQHPGDADLGERAAGEPGRRGHHRGPRRLAQAAGALRPGPPPVRPRQNPRPRPQQNRRLRRDALLLPVLLCR